MKQSQKQSSLDRIIGQLDKVESQFNALNDGMAHNERLATLGYLTSGIIHEINNLLTPVVAGIQLAISEPDDLQTQLRALERALQGAQSACSVADTILGFASPDDGIPAADIADCVQSALNCIARNLKNDGITLTQSIPAGSKAAISPQALQQILINLIINARNALKNTPGATLAISTQIAPESREFMITIKDNGPGISPKIMESMFEPFRSDHSMNGVAGPESHISGSTGESEGTGESGGTGGTGLGLSVCNHLVSAAEGEISVESDPDSGTTFTIRLPAAS